MHPRSGLAARHGISIVNAPGTVDEGYRGEILVNLVNLDPREPFTVRRGDRIAQLVVQRVERARFVEVDSLDETSRGDTGHGSTGGFGPGGAASPTAGETPTGRDHRIRFAGRCVSAATTASPAGHDVRRAAGLKGRNDVGLFSRGKSKDRPDADAVDAGPRRPRPGRARRRRRLDGDDAVTRPAATSRPLDRSEVDDDTDYLNLGAIWLRGQQGMELRLEVNEQEQQITGVTAVIGESAVQLQAFAAPRTEGVWIDIRNEIAAQHRRRRRHRRGRSPASSARSC